MNAKTLRGDDFPFEVIADHPGLVRANSEHFHRMGVGPFLGLAEAVLALDLDVVETLFESEPHDLGALRLGRAVGDQRQLDAQLLQPIEGLVRFGEQRQFLVMQGVIGVGQ